MSVQQQDICSRADASHCILGHAVRLHGVTDKQLLRENACPPAPVRLGLWLGFYAGASRTELMR
jgi:hypothetical protein